MTTDDIVQIHQTLALYGHAADSADPELLAQVFTEDATFAGSPTRPGVTRGLAELVEWFALGSPPHPRGHQTTNIYVYEEGDEVRARSKWIVVSAASGAPMTGDYEDLLVRTPSGWRIKERLATPRHREDANAVDMPDAR